MTTPPQRPGDGQPTVEHGWRPYGAMRRVFGFVTVGLTMTVSGPAWAASGSGGPTLEWIAPAACPDSATLQRTLVATLGFDVAADTVPPLQAAPPDSDPLRAYALVRRRAEGGWVLDLELERGESRRSRRIEAETCEGLASATVLVVAIAFDPLRPLPHAVRLIGSPESSVPEAPVTPAGSTGPSAPTAPRAASLAQKARLERGPGDTGDAHPAPAKPSAQREPPVFSLRAAGGAGLRVLPRTTGVIELSGGISGRSWRAEFGADVWVPARSNVGTGLQARFGLSAARVRGCGVPRVRPVSFPVCASLEAGAQTGRGVEGFSTTKRALQPWLAARAGGFVAWRVHARASIWAGGEAVFALLSPGFGTDVADDVVASPAVSAVVTAGVEVHFGRPKD